jgi:hypothetical protein
MNLRSAPVIACLALVLAACSSAVGDTDAGPNPGGGYYDGPNVNVGHVNPWPGSYESQAYSTVGWRTCRPAVLNGGRCANGEVICGSSFRLSHSQSASCLEHSGRHQTVTPRLTAFYRTSSWP